LAPMAILAQLPRSVCFESIKGVLRPCGPDGNNHMHVVRAYVNRVHQPATFLRIDTYPPAIAGGTDSGSWATDTPLPQVVLTLPAGQSTPARYRGRYGPCRLGKIPDLMLLPFH
jgi:hypothetical protein